MNKGNIPDNQKAILILAGKVNLPDYNFKSHEYLFNIGNTLAFQKIIQELDTDNRTKIYIAISKLNNKFIKFIPFKNAKYLISSHLVNIKINKKIISYINFIFEWFRERKLSNTKIIFYLIQALILVPFVYIKRLKYLKIT